MELALIKTFNLVDKLPELDVSTPLTIDDEGLLSEFLARHVMPSDDGSDGSEENS